MKVHLHFSIIFFLISFTIFAQTGDEMLHYQRAKKMIDEGKYQEGLDLITPYTQIKKYGDLSFYANYHAAKALYHLDMLNESITILKQVQAEKGWDRNDELRYLLALAYFKKEDYISGLQEIQMISDVKIFNEAENASYHHLKNASISELVPNVSKFGRNNGYVKALKEKMDAQIILSNDEKVIYKSLQESASQNTLGNKSLSKNTEVLDIALVLPFNHSGGSGVTNLSSNNFVFEFYQGFFMGLEDLKLKGRSVSLATYDTEKNPDKIKRILNHPKLNSADVIVGPLYPEEVGSMIEFSEKNQIYWVNPLSNVDEKLEKNRYSYLFRPSIQTLSEGVLEYIQFNLSGKRIGIGYSGVTRDESLANKIKEISVKFGIDVVVHKKISERDVRSFVNESSRHNLDAVIVLSDDPAIASPVLGLLESVSLATPLFVMDSWLYFNFANYEMFSSQKLHFIGNNSVNFQSERTERFRNEFFHKYQMNPSLNAHLGYELIQWLAQTISPQQGFDLKKNLNSKGKFQGIITYGFDYKDNNSNKYIPILKLINGELVVQ